MEIIPKKPVQYPIWFNLLFYAALIVFIFTLTIFFILNSSIKSSQNALSEIEAGLAKENTSEKTALREELADGQRKINDFSVLINQHLANTEPFKLIEKKTHPKVWFSQININPRERTVLLSGETQSFEALGQQLIAFREENVVDSAALTEVVIGKQGKIEFNLSLSLSPEIFKPVFGQPE